MTEDQANLLIVQLVRIADTLETLARVRPPSDADDQMLTPPQVGERLQISENLVRDMLARGDLHGVKVNGRWRVSQSELRRYAEGVARPVSNVVRMGSRPKGARR